MEKGTIDLLTSELEKSKVTKFRLGFHRKSFLTDK